MPPSLEHSKAVSIIQKGALDKVAARFPGSVIFEEGDTLSHEPVGQRLQICVRSKAGAVKNPPDESAKFNESVIVVPLSIDKAFVGPRTACRDLTMTDKQSFYTSAIPELPASRKFMEEIKRVYSHEVYAQAVAKHPMHAAKQIVKNSDMTKGIMQISRKNKLHTPITLSDEDGAPTNFVARRRVFGTRTAWKSTGTDFDTEAIQEFCEDNSKNGKNVCVDICPVFYADGSKCAEYDAIRSSSAAIFVISLRGDWCSTELANISFPNSILMCQVLNVGLSRGTHEIEAPNFMLDESEVAEAADNFAEEVDDGDSNEGDDESLSQAFKKRRTE